MHGCIVTIDAMGTQHKIARQIIDEGGDDVLALKSNQPSLYEDVRTFFEDAIARQFRGIEHDSYRHTGGGHGRLEVRQCYTSSDVMLDCGADQMAGAALDRDGRVQRP